MRQLKTWSVLVIFYHSLFLACLEVWTRHDKSTKSSRKLKETHVCFLGALAKWLFIWIANVIKIAYILSWTLSSVKKLFSTSAHMRYIIPWNVTTWYSQHKKWLYSNDDRVWRKSAGHDISWLTFNYDWMFDIVNFDRFFWRKK